MPKKKRSLQNGRFKVASLGNSWHAHDDDEEVADGEEVADDEKVDDEEVDDEEVDDEEVVDDKLIEKRPSSTTLFIATDQP